VVLNLYSYVLESVRRHITKLTHLTTVHNVCNDSNGVSLALLCYFTCLCFFFITLSFNSILKFVSKNLLQVINQVWDFRLSRWQVLDARTASIVKEMMKAVRISERFFYFHETSRHYNPEGCYLVSQAVWVWRDIIN
jgi:hypothetical protein